MNEINMIGVMQKSISKKGMVVQRKSLIKEDEWIDVVNPTWNWDKYEYRCISKQERDIIAKKEEERVTDNRILAINSRLKKNDQDLGEFTSVGTIELNEFGGIRMSQRLYLDLKLNRRYTILLSLDSEREAIRTPDYGKNKHTIKDDDLITLEP